jgi:hypothetical protein
MPDITPLPRESPMMTVASPQLPVPPSSPATPKPSPANVEASKQRALAVYPQLAKSGSPLNREFVRRYQQYQHTRPDYFNDLEWPMKLAKESFDAISAR